MTNKIIQMALKNKTYNKSYLNIDYKHTEDNMKVLQFIKTPFVLVGGWACSYYMPARQTKDIDLMINEEDAHLIDQELIGAGFLLIGSLSIGGASYKRINDNLDLDIIYNSNNWNSIYSTSLIKEVKVISLPYLILMKLESGRLQDLSDCARMLSYADDSSIKQIRRLIKSKSFNNLNDFDSLVELGKLELSN